MAMMGDRGAGFGRGRGMPGRGGPPRGRGGFDRGGARYVLHHYMQELYFDFIFIYHKLIHIIIHFAEEAVVWFVVP